MQPMRKPTAQTIWIDNGWTTFSMKDAITKPGLTAVSSYNSWPAFSVNDAVFVPEFITIGVNNRRPIISVEFIIAVVTCIIAAGATPPAGFQYGKNFCNVV